jgi:hypothetical protein
MKLSVPVNWPWGSARSSRVAPVHFRPPSGCPVLSLHIRAPFQVPRGPLARGSVCREVSCHLSELLWGLARSSREAPIHFWPQFMARFRAPCVHVLGPRLLLEKMKRSSFQVNCAGLSTLSSSSQILATQPVASHSPPMSSLTCLIPPHRHVAHIGSRNKVIAGRTAAC